MTGHEPSRPSWRCAACGHDWPCPRRREELLADTAGSVVSLAVLMANYFEAAVQDHPTVLISTLYVRFFGWVLQQPRNPGMRA